MGQNDDAVLAEMHVGLEGMNADIDGSSKGAECVLRVLCLVTTVGNSLGYPISVAIGVYASEGSFKYMHVRRCGPSQWTREERASYERER
jgi:hypothetical protein